MYSKIWSNIQYFIVVVSICSQIDLFLQVEYKARAFKSETYNTTINGCSRTARVRTSTEYMIRTMFVVFLPCLILLIFTIMLIYKTKKIRRWRKLNTCKSEYYSIFYCTYALCFHGERYYNISLYGKSHIQIQR